MIIRSFNGRIWVQFKATDLTLIRRAYPVTEAPVHVVTVKSVPLPTPSEFLELREDSHN